MVRLKELGCKSPIPDDLHFNSTMVRLKEVMDYVKKSGSPHFNSTMVRLKEFWDYLQSTNVLFQFHYGSIKSVRQTAR